MGQGPFTSRKSTRDARKLPEFEGEKPKTQVIKSSSRDVQGNQTPPQKEAQVPNRPLLM